jgi:FkbM family methyltransferase
MQIVLKNYMEFELSVNNFVVIESIYGKFIVNRHCDFQADALIKTGKTHIEQELANIFVIIDRLPPDAVVIDGGANIGFFTVPVAQRRKDINILSFEPQRTIHNALAGTLALNDINNVILHYAALGREHRWLTIPDVDYGKPQDFGMVRLDKRVNVPCNQWTDPRLSMTVQIDDLELDRLDFIKLDVEGFECEALDGACKSIHKHLPWIWVEYMLVGEQAIVDIINAISDDYDYYIADYQNMLCVPKDKADQINTSQLRKVSKISL